MIHKFLSSNKNNSDCGNLGFIHGNQHLGGTCYSVFRVKISTAGFYTVDSHLQCQKPRTP
jgi:hypothetical protein